MGFVLLNFMCDGLFFQVIVCPLMFFFSVLVTVLSVLRFAVSLQFSFIEPKYLIVFVRVIFI
jgi:hypothetical protein